MPNQKHIHIHTIKRYIQKLILCTAGHTIYVFKWIPRPILQKGLFKTCILYWYRSHCFCGYGIFVVFFNIGKFYSMCQIQQCFSFGFIVLIVKTGFYIKKKRHTKDYCIFLNTLSSFINAKEALSEFLCYLIGSNN